MNGQALFEKVVSLCGVSSVLAPGLVRRALCDGPAGPDGRKVQTDTATIEDYKTAMPRLLARLRAYMPEEEAQKRARHIGALLISIETGRESEEDTDARAVFGRVTEALRTGTPVEGQVRPKIAAQADELLDFDDGVTQAGRRFTAAEREILRSSGVMPAIIPQSEPPEDTKANEKPRR
jgi:hypothetical protein